jgi:hypothetical protein
VRWDYDIARLVDVIEYSFTKGEERVAAAPVPVA